MAGVDRFQINSRSAETLLNRDSRRACVKAKSLFITFFFISENAVLMFLTSHRSLMLLYILNTHLFIVNIVYMSVNKL